ncbi:MAG: carboxypeptidase-like regulatory domain-containing protein, partial [Planctomycetota bacterium]
VLAARNEGAASGELNGGTHAGTITDADGRYAFDTLEAGRYELRAGGPPATLTKGAVGGYGAVVRSDVELAAGERLERIDFELDAGLSIEGRVLDADGVAVPNAAVFVRDGEGRPVERISSTKSDATGSFQIEGLAKGRYTLLARGGAMASAVVGPVDLAAGSSTPRVELSLEAGTDLIVRVEVDGETDRDARIRVWDRLDHEVSGLVGQADLQREIARGFRAGEHRVGPLPPGTYRVVARAGDGREQDRRVELRGQAERRLRIRID